MQRIPALYSVIGASLALTAFPAVAQTGPELLEQIKIMRQQLEEQRARVDELERQLHAAGVAPSPATPAASKIRREGFSLLDMQRYLADIGFKADGFTVPLQKLFDSKLPAIVLITEKGYNHFVVIKGAEDGRVLLGDPSSGTRAITREHFEAIWPTRLLFVIHDTPNKPMFNAALDWRAAPHAPLAEGVAQSAIETFGLPKFGPGDF